MKTAKEIRLPLPAYAYRFDLLLEFARRIAFPARMRVEGDCLWRYTAGQLLCYRRVDNSILVSGVGLNDENQALVERASRHVLGLERDLSAFYTFARADAQLWSVVAPLVGLPIFCTETVFEALITLIIEQHITWKTALRAQSRLLQIFDDGAPVGPGRVYGFPAPAVLARAAPSDLISLKITNRRIALILDIAAVVARGELDLEACRCLSPSAAYARLISIKGVGPWTAGNVIGRAMGQYPYVGDNDVALQAALRQYFFDGVGTKSARQTRETLGACGQYAGLAAHFTLLRWVLDRYPPVSD